MPLEARRGAFVSLAHPFHSSCRDLGNHQTRRGYLRLCMVFARSMEHLEIVRDMPLKNLLAVSTLTLFRKAKSRSRGEPKKAKTAQMPLRCKNYLLRCACLCFSQPDVRPWVWPNMDMHLRTGCHHFGLASNVRLYQRHLRFLQPERCPLHSHSLHRCTVSPTGYTDPSNQTPGKISRTLAGRTLAPSITLSRSEKPSRKT